MSELYGVLSHSGDACKVTFEREYATSSADLWSALTEPGRLTRWLAPADGNLHEGGHAVVHFDDGDARFVIEVCAAPETWSCTGSTPMATRWSARRCSTSARTTAGSPSCTTR